MPVYTLDIKMRQFLYYNDATVIKAAVMKILPNDDLKLGEHFAIQFQRLHTALHRLMRLSDHTRDSER